MSETRTKVFISYSRSDHEWLQRLRVCLAPLEREGLVDPWDDTRIQLGDRWREEIDKALDEAAVAVFLVSQDYLASEFASSVELPRLLERAQAEHVRILPVVVGPCLFERSPLTDFQSPSNATPLVMLSKGAQDSALADVARVVLSAAGGRTSGQRAAPSAVTSARPAERSGYEPASPPSPELRGSEAPPERRGFFGKSPTAIVSVGLTPNPSRSVAERHGAVAKMSRCLRESAESAGLAEASQFLLQMGEETITVLLGGFAAGALLEYLSGAAPLLARAALPFGQRFRVGVHFDLLRWKDDAPVQVTEERSPGNHALQLQEAAGDDEVLCSEMVAALFSPHHPSLITRDSETRRVGGQSLQVYLLRAPNPNDARAFARSYLRSEVSRSPAPARTLLVVEDNEDSAESLREILEMDGWSVVVAHSGPEALELWNPGRFALVIADIGLPGIDGYEMARRMLAVDPAQPIVALTGYARPEDEVRAFEAGMCAHVPKPAGFSLLSVLEPFAAVDAVRFRELFPEPGARAMLNGLRRRLAHVLDRPGEGSQAGEMLRHKVKHMVDDFVSSLAPGPSPDMARVARFHGALDTIERLMRIAGATAPGGLYEFLQVYQREMSRMYRDVVFECGVTALPRDIEGSSRRGSLVALMIAELFDNAVAAMHERGSVSVTIETFQSTGLLQITVRDSGPGVPRHIEARLFEAGGSTKGEGRGHGLSLVSQAAHLLGGTITYRNVGSAEFRIILPL